MPTPTESSSSKQSVSPTTGAPPADMKSSSSFPPPRSITVSQSMGTPSPSPSPTTPTLQTQTPRLSRSERRLYDPTKTDVTQYTYHGGKTAVMSGGVMLGGAKHSRKDGSSKNPGGGSGAAGKDARTHKRGSDSGDWRKPPDAKQGDQSK